MTQKERVFAEAEFMVENYRKGIEMINVIKAHLDVLSGRIFNARILPTIGAEKTRYGHRFGDYSIEVVNPVNNTWRYTEHCVRLYDHVRNEKLNSYTDFKYDIPIVLNEDERIDAAETRNEIDGLITRYEKCIEKYETRMQNYDAAQAKLDEVNRLKEEIKNLGFYVDGYSNLI